MEAYYEKDNITIYHNDNINVLRELPSESITMIYCDILYNSRKDFADYNDDLGTPEEAIEWYRPRFYEMKRVLASNGSIFIHCNWQLDGRIRDLMDEVFGPANFRNRIFRQHSRERGFFRNYDSQMDFIYYYVKDINNFIFNELHGVKKRCIPLFENGYMKNKSETRYFNGTPIDLKSSHKHWLVTPKEFQEMISADEVILKNGFPYRVSTVIPIGNLWAEKEMLDAYSRTDISESYDTPKPEAILERLITIHSNKGDMVADFFLGGGTTAVVAKRLGRKGVFCDISEKACQVTIQKLDMI